MQGSVAGSGWGASWLCHGGAALRSSLSCWQLSLALCKLAFHGCFLRLGNLRAMCCPLLCRQQGQALGCSAGSSVDSRSAQTAPPRWVPCSEPSSHLLAQFAPVPLASPARWVPVVTPCSMVVMCVFPSASTSTAPGLRLDLTAHPMSESLQILPANSYANYLISCLIYFLCR